MCNDEHLEEGWVNGNQFACTRLEGRCGTQRDKSELDIRRWIVTFLICLSTYSLPRADIFHNRPSNSFAFMCVLPILCPLPFPRRRYTLTFP